jgi:hypothetical protein
MSGGGVVMLAAALVGASGCHQKPEGAGGHCGGPDAGAGTAAPASLPVSNDPGCPATWAGTNPSGYPAVCTTSGLICTYPEGQAECALDGSTLKWWPAGATPGCGETAPTLGAACGSPGLVCEYITGPPNGTFTTNYCCDGTTCGWTLEGSQGCSNGNTCGSIAAADYDQSCSADSDCVMEPEGNFCDHNHCTDCATGVISVKAQAQYEVDLASRIAAPELCPCPSGSRGVCNQGRCATAPVITF